MMLLGRVMRVLYGDEELIHLCGLDCLVWIVLCTLGSSCNVVGMVRLCDNL